MSGGVREEDRCELCNFCAACNLRTLPYVIYEYSTRHIHKPKATKMHFFARSNFEVSMLFEF